MKWTEDNTKAKRLMIVKELAPCSVKTLLFLEKKDMVKLKGQNTRINNTLHNWKHICKKYKIDNELFYLREMGWDPQFTPIKMDNILKIWSSKGLQIYSQILLKHNVDSFEAISNRFSLAQSHFYKYLQVRNYINNLKKEGIQDQHPLISYMIKKVQ